MELHVEMRSPDTDMDVDEATTAVGVQVYVTASNVHLDRMFLSSDIEH
jgi:hypothetical protein